MLITTLGIQAQYIREYTDEKPLIIAVDWEFPPYEFADNFGNPAGIHIDILDAILEKLSIPHQYVMKDWKLLAETFKQHHADIILDPINYFYAAPYVRSNSILTYYNMKVASTEHAEPIQSMKQLEDASGLVLRSNGPISHRVINELELNITPEFQSPKDAMAGLGAGKYKYFMWGEESLKWKIKELGLEDKIVLDQIDIPAGEIHFVGYDEMLINQIDDQFARMEQNGDIERLRNKWLHPERTYNDASPMSIPIVIGIILLVIGLVITNRLIVARVKHKSEMNKEMERMMRQALDMGNYYVIVYDVKTNRYTNRHGSMLPEEGLTLLQLLSRIHPDDAEMVEREVNKLIQGEILNWELTVRWNIGTSKRPHYQIIHGNAIAEKDKNGKTRYIMNTLKNVTKEYEQEFKDNELANKYMKLFDQSLVAMSFYNKEGMLIDLNENMRQLCHFDEEGEQFFKKTSIFEAWMFSGDLKPGITEQFHACHRMYYPEVGLDSYLEFRVKPIFQNGELLFYVVTARDITDERNMYMEQYNMEKQLKQTNKQIVQYEKELNYLLEKSDMWVWRSDLKTQMIYFSRSLKHNEFSQSFEDYMNSLYEEDVPKALAEYNNFNGSDKNFNVTHHFKHTLVSDTPLWIAVSGMPTYDEEGNPSGHFGVIRDVTKLMEAQEQLKRETNRAEDSGKLKSIFLANMTHEIRTPLNAIVGFSDLLQVIEEPADRREFIRIIRNNCDMLMRLINDIIEASNMNEGPLSIEAEDVDFALAFNDICQTLAQRVQEPGVEFIVDNPYTTFLTHLDKGRMQQVITNFTTNAVKYTQQGHIKVGYRYENGGIYMYCEDTGAGIPKEKQASVFERFVKLNDYVQGTGLGLAICKSIADRCGGRIGISSEGLGKGSTFWIWIPCENKTIS
jgi:signal transduction histidine kinase/ABC-type amino acid transport substrate-binding protein